jgi:hypothetical protein
MPERCFHHVVLRYRGIITSTYQYRIFYVFYLCNIILIEELSVTEPINSLPLILSLNQTNSSYEWSPISLIL